MASQTKEFILKNTFREKVYKVVSKIPKGELLSYKEVAIKAGSPLAFRAVGNIMHNNPDPKKVPCHRVVASGYKLGGYAWGTDAKIKKLAAEGWKLEKKILKKI